MVVQIQLRLPEESLQETKRTEKRLPVLQELLALEMAAAFTPAQVKGLSRLRTQ